MLFNKMKLVLDNYNQTLNNVLKFIGHNLWKRPAPVVPEVVDYFTIL